MFKTNFKIVLALALVVGAGSVYAITWTAPTFPPPPGDCPSATLGCNPPVNISNINQIKAGGLVAGGLGSLTNIVLKGVPDGILNGIISDTIDGADNKYVSISGGGAINDHTRGANMTLWGNEFSFLGLGGSMLLKTGGVGSIIFQTGVIPTERIRIISTGNVGIGVSAPASKLDVNGDICWAPPGGTRRCLGNSTGGGGSGGSSLWQVDPTDANAITNVNSGKVNVASKIRIGGGNPAANKILIAQDDTGLATWESASNIPGVGGIGNDVLNTTFTGCVAGLGCLIRNGDAGPTQSHSILDGVGTVTMTCPTGYKVVSGGADCDKSWNAIVAVQVAFLNASRPISKTQWQVQCTKLSGSYVSLITTENASAIKNASITCAR